MRKRLLASLLAAVMVLTLLPTAAFAQEGGGSETAEPVKSGYILIGATRGTEGTDGNLSPRVSGSVTYAITLTGDNTYTLTFSGDGEIPDYYTENQGYAEDGTEIYKTNGTWQDARGNTEGYSGGPANASGTYRWCTSDRAYYRSTQWDVFNTDYEGAITKVVFEEGITGIGQFTLFNMTGVTEIEIQNPNCDISNNAVYYNGVDSPAREIIVDSKAYNDKAVGYYNMGTHTIGPVSYTITDAEEFVNTYSNLLSLDTNALTEKDRTAIENAHREYTQGNDIFRNAVDSASVTVDGAQTTFGAAFDAIYEAATGTDPDTIALKGYVLNSTVQYELTTEDDGKTYTLRFFDESGKGEMPDFVIDEENKENPERYQLAPWYDNDYRLKITHVIYDESIARTGYLSAAHLYKCTQFDFLNPNVKIASATIHYNDNILAESVKLRYSGNVENASRIVAYRNEKDREKVSVSYLEIEEFLNEYGDLFTQETIEKKTAEELKAGFEALPTACKVQLGIDEIPDTDTTYRDKLDALLAAAGSGPVDDSEVLESGVIPSADGENETVHYEITTDDNETYTVRFYDNDGDGVMPDYQVTTEEDGRNQWYAYETLPWRIGHTDDVVKMIFDESITYVGQHVAANMNVCTEYEFLNPYVDTSVNAIYYYTDGHAPAAPATVTIHAYGTADIKIGYGNNVSDDVKARIQISYYEAEQFEANTKYAALWMLEDSAAADNASLIQQAYREYNSFADAVKQQLDTDTIPNTTTTYADKLTDLMAQLNLGGDVSGDVDYTLSLNEDNSTYTLTLSGSGEVPGENLPWAARAGEITEVVLEDGITGVAARAFVDLTALKSVDVAESVETIDSGAFPTTSFEMHGWLNHASGQYADANDKVQLKLKDLRILAIGNSHTSDYTAFFSNILGDLDDSVATDITYQVLASGGRGLYIEQGERSSHYHAATTEGYTSANGLDYADYQAAFKETWDIVIVQDYHESTKINDDYGGANYADEMQTVIAWLRGEVPGAKIAWFADWAEGVNGMDKLPETYQQSVAAMDAINTLETNKPDFIIPASTVLQNARTTYLGTTRNDENALVNWDGNFSDFAKGQLQNYSLLERDSTHMSLELGRQLMGTFVLYSLFQQYAGEIVTVEDFNFFGNLDTAPEYTHNDCYWAGEFTQEIWDIIEESCEDAWTTKTAVTNATSYTTDPFTAKYESVKSIISTANGDVDKSQISQTYLENIFKSESVLRRLADITGLGITADDVTVTYTAPVAGTLADPTGKDGGYTVVVDCHYGYSYPTENALTVTIPASQAPGADDALETIKQQAIKKLNSYMSDDSYAEGVNRRTVVDAKSSGKTQIEGAETATAVQEALFAAEKKIDEVETIFGAQYHTGGNCVEYGQIWTGGWDYSEGFINKNSYTMDIEGNATTYDSVFTGVWWVVFANEDGGYRVEFFKDPGTGYSFETPVYNPSHWLDPLEQTQHSENPLQYNQTPWFKGYRNTLTKAVVHSGVTINPHTLACYPNITEYVIEDGANLGTNAIYFNPLQNDTVIRFRGASTVEKDAVSGYRVANSYGYYIDVHGDMSKVTISSNDSMNGQALQSNLYYAFGKYNNNVQAWVASAEVYETIAVGLAGEGEDITTGAGFAPHYTDGVPDGTTMLRVFNNNPAHAHTPVPFDSTTSEFPCETHLDGGTYCSDCHAIVTTQTVVQGTGHTWMARVTKQPTATERGEITYTCDVCGVEKIEYTGWVQEDDVNDVVSVNGAVYSSLDYAISRAEPGDVVVLLKDVAQTVNVEAGQAGVIVDLNGCTFTGNITVSGSIIIQSTGNGKVNGTITVAEGGSVQILSGTYSTDVTGYCPDGYGVIKNQDDTYTVHQHVWNSGTATTPPTSTTTGVRTYACTVEGCSATRTEIIPATGITTDPDSGSSGGSSEPSYSPVMDVTGNGDVRVNPRTPSEGDEVTITVEPDRGYEVDEVIVRDRNGNRVDVTAERNGTYTFEQPRGRVTIEVTFVPTGENTFFVDVPETFWAYNEIEWAYENGYVNGTTTTTFSPNASISRQQVWMILARLSGADPANMAAARQWAIDNGISDGTTPGNAVTRQQLVALLYRYATLMGYANDARADLSIYPDAGTVASYAVEPMQWSVANNIVAGTSDGTLNPTGTATRAQFAVILYRFWEQIG